ncbi:MAG: hypothetical protein Q8P41_24400 [Pseudomonadota bacterium]|nr:hypothetical protein [Pseudomonadota bacterium]
MRALTWLVMLGCGPTPCERLAEVPARDTCFHVEILALPTSAVATVAEIAPRIQDPVVRNATLLAWARDHREGVDPAGASALCALLPVEEARMCERRLFAAHLAR